jgi:hypothetical protein
VEDAIPGPLKKYLWYQLIPVIESEMEETSVLLTFCNVSWSVEQDFAG